MSEMTPAEFIKTLKVGDKVEFVTTRGYTRHRTLMTITVTRFTPTQIVCVDDRYKNEVRYRLDNGNRVGGHYDKFPLPVDAETRAKVVDEMEALRLAGLLTDLTWRNLPLEKLRRVMQLVKEEDGNATTDK